MHLTGPKIGSLWCVHPDFSAPADVVLVAEGGTEFHVQVSDLARSSGWFRTLFTVPQGENHHSAQSAAITVSEDSLTLEILLKLACGLPPGLTRLETLVEVERVLIAAEKYEMPGVTEVVVLLLRLPVMQKDTLHIYAVAGRYGQADLAAAAVERLIRMPLDVSAVAHVDVAQLAHLVSLRQQRIERFCAFLLKNTLDAPGSDARCLHDAIPPRLPPAGSVFSPSPSWGPSSSFASPASSGSGKHAAATPDSSSRLALSNLVAALQGAFIKHPSVEALERDPVVKRFLLALESARCPHSECRQNQYDWADIRARLAEWMDSPDNGPPDTLPARRRSVFQE